MKYGEYKKVKSFFHLIQKFESFQIFILSIAIETVSKILCELSEYKASVFFFKFGVHFKRQLLISQ